LQDIPEPIRIKAKNSRILQQNCIACHQGLISEIIDHGEFADGTNTCVHCHAAVGHGPTR
jgi:cytochrome c nitrite reductase small subunit